MLTWKPSLSVVSTCIQAIHAWQEVAGQDSSLAALRAAADIAATQAAAQENELQGAASQAAADLQVCFATLPG